MIESYNFGKIRIDGKEYTHDVIISADGVESWQRPDNHWAGIEDVKKIIEKKPKTVIFSTGYSGVAKVSEETKEHLKKLGIEVVIEPTKKACDTFNKLSKDPGVIAALHLTC